MRFFKLNIRFIIISALLISLLPVKGYSQGTDSRAKEPGRFYIGLNIIPSQTSIHFNSIDTTIFKVKTSKKNTLFGTFELGYKFSKYLGLSTGIGFSNYSTSLSLPVYSNKYDTIDSEGDNYRRFVSGNNINETQKIMYLVVPVLVNLQVPFNEKFGFYLQSGVNLSFAMNKKYSSTGTFSYTGYYSMYDVTMENIQYEKLLNNQKADRDGELKVKSISPEWITSAGFNYVIQNKMELSAGGFYSRMLSDLSDYSSSNSFRLTSIPNQMRSMMEGSSQVTARSLGLKLSFRYYFK